MADQNLVWDETFPGKTPVGKAWFAFSLGNSVHTIDSDDAFMAGWEAALHWQQRQTGEADV